MNNDEYITFGDVTYETIDDFISDQINFNSTNNQQDDYGNTILMILVTYSSDNKHLEVIKNLIKTGVDLNFQNSNGKTALMIAVSSIETVKLLIDSGANLEIKDNSGMTALMIASKYTNTIDTDTDTGNRFTEIVKLLVNSGANLNAQDNTGMTALMWASNNWYATMYAAAYLGSPFVPGEFFLETVKILVDSGADLNIKNNHGHTGLSYLAICGYNFNINYYLKNNPKLEEKNGILLWCAIRINKKNSTHDIIKFIRL
jgi:ankyrin repeat protein